MQPALLPQHDVLQRPKRHCIKVPPHTKTSLLPQCICAQLRHQFFCMEYAFKVLDARPLPQGKTGALPLQGRARQVHCCLGGSAGKAGALLPQGKTGALASHQCWGPQQGGSGR